MIDTLRGLFGVKEGVRQYLHSRHSRGHGGYGTALNDLNRFILRYEESREGD